MSDPILRLNAALEGRYAVDRRLGEGGMATVYLAHDLRHDRPVAIKVLKPELAAVLGAERFLSEIKTTANLQHPHILPLHDSGEADGFLFYVMPYVEGESLREKLDRETQLPIDEAVAVTRKVASALQAAHDQGVVHRDIKPANILMASGEPLVADFGIALAVQQAGGGRLTETGLSLGTPHYMSPEQATAERAPDARSDVYSLGCVLYEMLTGEPPFTGPTAQAIVARLLSADPAPVTEIRKTVPPHVAGAALTALQKLPADRFASTAELARALAEEGSFASGGHPTATDASRGAGSSRTGTLLPWAIAAVAVLGLAATLLTRGSSEEAEPREHRSVRVTLPPLDPPLRGELAFSRDGSQIVYVGGRPLEPNRLWVRSLSDPEVRVLPGTENPLGVAVSWDGRWATFWADSAMRKVSLDGGSPLTMVRTSNLPRGITWTGSGDVVLGMLSGSGPHGMPGLALLRDEAGARPDTLTVAEGMHHDPVPLDESTVLFLRMRGGLEIGVASLDTGEWEGTGLRGRPIGVADGILLYSVGGISDGNLMAVRWDEETRRPIGESIVVPGMPSDFQRAQLSADGTLVFTTAVNRYEVVVVGEGGAEQSLQPGEIVSEIFPRFSPDGRTLAMGADFRGISDVWLYDSSASALTPLSFGFDAHSVGWTPDGGRVRAGPSRVETMWNRPADGSEEATADFEIPEAVQGGRGVLGVEASPDGETLALVRNVSQVFGASTFDIVLVSRADPATEIPFATGPADQRQPRFSPNGEWLAYTSDESGRYEVHVRQVGGSGARRQVSRGGGRQPVWSADGARLHYWVGDRLVAVDITDSGSSGLEFGAERTILQGTYFQGGSRAVTATYDVSPDGSQVVLARQVGEGGSLTVWIDWMHELHALFDDLE
jgi:serine/threonine-protein kinase